MMKTQWATGTFLILALVAELAAQAPNWTLQNPQNAPSGRSTPSMAYDSAHSQVVLFGGFGGPNQTTLGDTWVWDGTNWTLKFSQLSPPPRSNSAMAYDAAHGQIVLFGGSGESNDLADTWVWDGTSWTEKSPQTSPPARASHAMAYDAAHNQIVLFGGVSPASQALNDTWLWDGTNWTQESPQTSPSNRCCMPAAFDSTHNQVFLFGGLGPPNVVLADTWVWNGTNWTQASPKSSPPARYFPGVAYDSAHSQMVMFGGVSSSVLGDTWVWDGSSWTVKSPQTSPPNRDKHAMAFDAGHNLVVMFGGRDQNGNFFDDTWTWSGGPVATPPPPTPAITSIESASAYGGFSNVAPGSWVEIYGSNLAPDTRQWAGSDFSGSNAPTLLDGVEVSIGGQKAFIAYISASPGQINAQLPSNIPTGGPLQLTVTNANGTSSPYNLTVNAAEPGLLAPSSFIVGGKQYVVALEPDNATYIAPPGSIPGVTSRQASPGDTLTMYGIGFGAVTPNSPAGQVVAQSNQLVQPLQILFGQTPAQVTYDGLAAGFVGLYQFDVVVPPVPDNDLTSLTFNLGGTAGTQTLYIAVKQAASQ